MLRTGRQAHIALRCVVAGAGAGRGCGHGRDYEFTVVRDHPEQSFHVNMRGALNVMQAAVEHGIEKVIHSGPQFVRRTYDHDFDIEDVPRF